MDIKGVTLTEHDRSLLVSDNGWLNDNIIHAAENLLQSQFSHVNGLQDPILEKNQSFDIMGERPFVQILHINSNHWITIYSIGGSDPHIKVYDTLHSSLPAATKKTIADLLHTNQKSFLVEYMNVQEQEGGSDCGLLAVAIATSLCNKESPESLEYEQESLREHLALAFISRELTPFPSKPVARELPSVRNERVKVFCVCRQIKEGKKMVQCDGCKELYHVNCVNVPNHVLRNKTEIWYCQPSCNRYTYKRVADEVVLMKVSSQHHLASY